MSANKKLDTKRYDPLAIGVPTKERRGRKVEVGFDNFGGGREEVRNYGGKDRRGSSIFKRGRGSLAICLMESKDGLGGGGLVIVGGRSSSVSKRAWGEVRGVKNKSLIGSMLMAKGKECLDGWVGAGGGKVKGGGVDFGVTKSFLGISLMNVDEPQSLEIAPLSPYYVPGPEEPEQAPLSPKYVPELVYPEYLASLDDDILAEYQPLPADASLTTLSPGYIADSDPLEDQEEDPEDGPEEDPADYPVDRGDKEEEESSRDDADDEDEENAFKETKDTKAFETDESAPTPPSPRLRMARISVRPQTPMVAATEALIDAIATALPSSSPLPSPLTPLPQIPSPPLPLPSPPLPLPAPSSPLLLPATDRREDVPEADVSLRKRLCLTAPTPRFKVGESLVAAAARQPGLDVTMLLVMINMIRRDRQYFNAMAFAFEKEAMYARGAWASSKDRSTTIEAHILETRRPARTDDPEDADSKNASKENHHPYVRCRHKALVTISVADALAEHEANRSRNRDERHDSKTGSKRTKRVTRECTFGNQVKYATCTLLGNALTWWNSHVKTIGHDAAYGMLWKTLMKMMTEKYCPRGEIKKLEIEIWNLKGGVMASKPKTMQDAIEFAIELMDQKIRTFADCQAKNKRKLDDNIRNNQNQQQPFKKQNVSKAYTTGPGEKKVSPVANANANNQETSRDKPELQFCYGDVPPKQPLCFDFVNNKKSLTRERSEGRGG
nr:hypothetical protein [Tanacetum cinerariifolium]